MLRIPEPELMDDREQARAYAAADFAAPHTMFVDLLAQRVPTDARGGHVLDLGCGPADITIRFTRSNAGCRVTGVDGAPAMIELGRCAVADAGLVDRIDLQLARLPFDPPRPSAFDGVLSNALLHHLDDPLDLWRTARAAARPDAWLFVMDLRRPSSARDAARLVETYAATEPEVLKRDFYNSLLAAYEPVEVRQQLDRVGLGHVSIEIVSDRHWIAWTSTLPA